MNKTSSWYNFQQHYLELPEVGFSLDTSLMDVPDVPPNSEEKLFQSAFQQMQALEDGGIANPDENRMVGHYWLRNPELAPSTEIQNLISSTIENIQQFTQEIQQKRLVPQKADSFQNVLLLGIGGSALAPQFIQNAHASETDIMQYKFIDNTDPDGIDRVMSTIGDKLKSTLTLVISNQERQKKLGMQCWRYNTFMKNPHWTSENMRLQSQAKRASLTNLLKERTGCIVFQCGNGLVAELPFFPLLECYPLLYRAWTLVKF